MTTQEANVRRYISTSRKMTNERILSFSIDLNLRGKNQKRYRQIQNGSVKTGKLKLMQFSTNLKFHCALKFHCDAWWVALLLRISILSEIP
jgi:hypothetical protein